MSAHIFSSLSTQKDNKKRKKISNVTQRLTNINAFMVLLVDVSYRACLEIRGIATPAVPYFFLRMKKADKKSDTEVPTALQTRPYNPQTVDSP